MYFSVALVKFRGQLYVYQFNYENPSITEKLMLLKHMTTTELKSISHQEILTIGAIRKFAIKSRNAFYTFSRRILFFGS